MHKILHIITRLDMGGSAQNTLLTCIGLTDKYEVVLVHGLSRESGMTDLEKTELNYQIRLARCKGVKTIASPALVRKIDPFRDVMAFFSLLQLICREKPAIVHTHSSKAGILGRLAARISGVPTIIHTPHGHAFFGHFNPLTSKMFLLIERFFDSITDCMVALTEGEKEDYIELSVSRREKIATIHSGVEIDRFTDVKISIDAKKETIGLDPDHLVVGTVGLLLAVKGPACLLEAMVGVWQEYPDARLVFVGKGDLEEKLKAKAFEMETADKVLFLGWRDDIPEIMQLFDVFSYCRH